MGLGKISELHVLREEQKKSSPMGRNAHGAGKGGHGQEQAEMVRVECLYKKY